MSIKKRSSFIFFTSFSIAIFSLFMTNSGYASQPKNTIDSLLLLSLEELINLSVTTASFFPETDLDTGSSVTVIKHSYWQDRGARRLDDALSYMPGVAINPTFVGTKQWVIRGYPNSNATGVQTLWDGVPLNTFPVGAAQADHPNIQLNTLDSIEVIRGPGSALYGSDAMHGVVSLKAYESDHDEAIASIRSATNGYYDGSLNASYKFSDNWRTNIAIATSGQPDQDFDYEYLNSGVPATAERDYNYSTTTTSIKLGSDPNQTLSYNIGFFYNKYDHDGFYHNGSDVPADDTSLIDTYLGIIKFETNYKLSNSKKLTANLAGLKYDRHFSRTLPNLNLINIFAEEEQNTFNLIYTDQKLQDNTELSLALGYKDNFVESAHRTVNDPAGTELLTAPLFFSEEGRTIKSFLLDGKTRFIHGQNILHYGFRFDDYSDFGEQFTPRVGFIHHLKKNKVIKTLYGNSFRAPTGNELFGGPRQQGDLNLKPEELDTIELIYITKHNKWKAEATLFYSELKNGIRLFDHDNDPNTLDKFSNISKSDSTGVELSYVKSFSHWTLDTNGSYILSQNQTDDVEYSIFPDLIFNLALGYQFKNNWKLLFNNHIETGRTRVLETTTNSPDDLPNYYRADLHLERQYIKSLKLFINVRNIFNRENELPSTQDSPRSGNFTSGIQEEEISLDIGINYQF